MTQSESLLLLPKEYLCRAFTAIVKLKLCHKFSHFHQVIREYIKCH